MTTLRRQVKNMVKNYSEAEVKVREATSNDPWGPSSTLMSEISDLTYNIVALGEVMRMIWKRLNDHGKNWRHVYKSLVLLDYLIKNGNEKVAQQCKEHIVAIQTLKDFQHMEEQKDQGASVREKAKQLVSLLRDDERLKAERTKAFRARERYAQNAMGISSDNKVIYATGNPRASSHIGSSTRTNGGNYADPYGGAAGVDSNLAPDLEAVRPSDANEEDLQIKLAIMLSQQEHEEEVQRKRTDDAKLQIALEQSKTEGQPNGLVDLSDLNGSSAFGNADPWGAVSSAPRPEDTDSDEFFPPLSSVKTPVAADPWGPKAAAPAAKSNGISALNDPWKTNSPNVTPSTNPSNPWLATSTTPNTASLVTGDPWSSPSVPQNKPEKTDDFDLFTTNRMTTTASTQPVASSNVDPFGDFFGGEMTTNNNKNTNPWNDTKPATTPTPASTAMKNSSSISFDPFSSNTTAATVKNLANTATRKTPESFLGENSSLVNLDNLIPTSTNSNILASNRPKSTNPFGNANPPAPPMSATLHTSTSIGQLNNPFLAQQQTAPFGQPKSLIGQIQQPIFPFSTTTPMATNAFSQPPLIPPMSGPNVALGNGQLAQPLIIAPTSAHNNIMPMSFGAPLAPSPALGTTTPAGMQSLFPSLSSIQPATTNNTNNMPSSSASTNPFLMI